MRHVFEITQHECYFYWPVEIVSVFTVHICLFWALNIHLLWCNSPLFLWSYFFLLSSLCWLCLFLFLKFVFPVLIMQAHLSTSKSKGVWLVADVIYSWSTSVWDISEKQSHSPDFTSHNQGVNSSCIVYPLHMTRFQSRVCIYLMWCACSLCIVKQ